MPDLNRVQLMGRLTFEPELRRIPSGTALTELRMAVNRSWKDKNGEWKEEVLYIDATVWGDAAERICNSFHKGNLIFVEGSLKMEQWDDKTTGEKRSKIKVNADRVQNLEPKPRDGDQPQQGGYNGGGERRQQPQAESRGGPTQGRSPAPQGRGGGYSGQGGTRPVTQAEVDGDDSDIPFARPREFDENEFFGPSVFEGER